MRRVLEESKARDLPCPLLTKESRAAVWTNFIGTAVEMTGHSSIDNEGIARLAKRKLDGRQIKNAAECDWNVWQYFRGNPSNI